MCTNNNRVTRVATIKIRVEADSFPAQLAALSAMVDTLEGEYESGATVEVVSADFNVAPNGITISSGGFTTPNYTITNGNLRVNTLK